MPEISVIIPVHNRPDLLDEAIASVFFQSLTDFEIVIVDDGSSDETPSVIETWQSRDKRVKVLTLEHSGYPGLARNKGAEMAEGQYLAFLDSDDLWLKNKLEAQIGHLKACGVKISHTREKWLRNGKEISQSGQKHCREGDLFGEALKKCMIGPSTVMMDKKLFHQHGGFRDNLEIAEDYDFWIRLTAGEPVGYLDEPLTIKRAGHGEQLSGKYGQIEIFRIRVLMDLMNDSLFNPEQKSAIKDQLEQKIRIYVQGCRKRGRNEEALYYEGLIQSK